MVRAFAAFIPFILPLHAFDLPPLHGRGPDAVRRLETSEDGRTRPGPPNPAAYEGLAAWVDIYNHGLWNRPVRTVRRMHGRGVTTLFLQTGNYGAARDVYRPRATAAFLRAAHRRDMYVVGWYVPSFAAPQRDWRRTRAAVRFRADGHRFDSFAMDIEATTVGNIRLRNRRLVDLSRRLRAAVGRSYPLGAIIPDVGSSYWPDFPYRRMRRLYDVFLPMAYYTFRTSGYNGVLANARANLRRIRVQTGDLGTPVHLIGGLAGSTTATEVRAFVRGARKFGAIGASLYDYAITDDDEWRELRGVTRRRPPRPDRASGGRSRGSDGLGERGSRARGRERGESRDRDRGRPGTAGAGERRGRGGEASAPRS